MRPRVSTGSAVVEPRPRVLPRLDWLLLLQEDRPDLLQRVLCLGGDESIVEALALVAGARRVDTALPAAGVGYDLVMVNDPDDVAGLARALHHVRPGGIACVLRRRGGLPVRATCRMLGEAGLSVRGRWAVLPDSDQPKRYLPVDHPQAWHWYLQNLFVASTPELRAQRIALRVVARSSELTCRVAPAVVVLAIREPAGTSARTGVTSGGHRRVAMLVTSGYDSGSRAVVLPFEPGEPWPAEVVKVARREEVRDATRLEHTRLTELRRTLPPELVRALPPPRGLDERKRSTAARQGAARGPLLSLAAGAWARRPEAAERDVAEIGAWLAGLHRATAGPAGGVPGELWLRAPLRRLTQMQAVSTQVQMLVAAAADRLDALAGELPGVVQHYDVGPWNIVRERAGLVLLDWELDVPAGRTGWGPPLVDFLYFACAWYNLATRRPARAEEIQGLLEAFGAPDPDGSVWQRRLLDRQLAVYLHRTGIPPAAVRPLLVACWLERAGTARSRWERLREGRPDGKGLEFLGALAASGFLAGPAEPGEPGEPAATTPATGRPASASRLPHAR